MSGCEEAAMERDNSVVFDEAVTATASPWQPHDATHVLREQSEFSELMQEAIARAHETAVTAQREWRTATPEEAERWMIKWAAPTLDDTVEYLWVRPLVWTDFRIEGILLNTPVRETGYDAGGMVGFPIEEMADWVYLIDGDMSSARRGGFTIDVLQSYADDPRP